MDLNDLKTRFKTLYPTAGTPFLCRIPGRVNLMGEHLDYNGLPVLPMAIDRAIHIAFAPASGGKVRLSNVDTTFQSTEFVVAAELEVVVPGAWENYAKAAIQGINEHFSVSEFPGLDLLIASDLPRSAGLSSSSALVVGVGMAYLSALGMTLGEDISRLEFAGLLANAEQFVGTAGGGMDQTVILHGEDNHASRINFLPFHVEQVPLPDDVALIICDSLTVASKSGDMLRKYNAGPASCNLMMNLINAYLQREYGEDFAIDCLGDLWFGPMCFHRAEVQALFDTVFPVKYMSPEAIAKSLGISLGELSAHWLDHMAYGKEGLPLQARARHVFSEYYRVEEGRDALLAQEARTFGQLMNASHKSCAIDYEISTPDLDELCQILTDEGCYGARLTGAGFGGAVVAMVSLNQLNGALDGVNRRYYSKRVVAEGYCPAFQVRAEGGASYY